MTSALAQLLSQWLPQQRWFSGKGRSFETSLTALTTLTNEPPHVTIWLAELSFASGERVIYQIPLVTHYEPQEGLEHVLVGVLDAEEGRQLWYYDALHDKQVTQVWLAGLRDEASIGPVTFARNVDPLELPLGSTSLVLTSEQSNTSLVYGDQAILKVFRRLERGINPDIEIHAALGEFGATNVARLLGSVSAEIDGEPVSLAMLQEFMSTATDGWELARASVRDLMAEADLHAEEAGGDFAGEAERLGSATAAVHQDLAEAFGDQTATERAERAERANAMHARLDAALLAVPQLTEVEAGVRQLFHEFGTSAHPLRLQRVHGDFHLGQVLRTVRRWIILDFEGEPSSPISERRQFDSPLRDVAAMLRSFDYAARYQLIGSAPSSQLEYRAVEWSERNRSAYLDGYTETAGYDPREDAASLLGFEADKAVYEAVYEARNRPDWLPIPLAALSRLVKAGEQEAGP